MVSSSTNIIPAVLLNNYRTVSNTLMVVYLIEILLRTLSEVAFGWGTYS
jgi:hypothetical protein